MTASGGIGFMSVTLRKKPSPSRGKVDATNGSRRMRVQKIPPAANATTKGRFLCFAQRGLSLHGQGAKNALKSNIAKMKMQQKYILTESKSLDSAPQKRYPLGRPEDIRQQVRRLCPGDPALSLQPLSPGVPLHGAAGGQGVPRHHYPAVLHR